MVEKQRIINAVRAEMNFSVNTTDAEIVEICEDSFTWAIIHWKLALSDLKEAIKKAFAF